MTNDITNKIWTKKKNIDEETERLIELYHRAYDRDRESPQTKALEEELKRRNPADVPAITYDAIRRIVALNKAAEKYPRILTFKWNSAEKRSVLALTAGMTLFGLRNYSKKTKLCPTVGRASTIFTG